MEQQKLVIIGSGPAGYTAAIYAARANLKPVLYEGFLSGPAGGQLMTTTEVENYPGFPDVIQGPWLMEQMQKQAEHVGTRIVTDHVNEVELGQRPFRLLCDSNDVYLADALIIATEWKAYRSPNWAALKASMKAPVIFDGRNLYEPQALQLLGVHYLAIGRSNKA